MVTNENHSAQSRCQDCLCQADRAGLMCPSSVTQDLLVSALKGRALVKSEITSIIISLSYSRDGQILRTGALT